MDDVAQPQLLRASFAAIGVAMQQAHARQKHLWSTTEAPALTNQLAALEETIAILEKEIAARRAAAGAVAAPSDDGELLLGQLEDKLLKMQGILEETRRARFFPSVDGYTLRFSYGETYLGFKELTLERLRGTVRLKIVPGVSASGEAQVPSVRFVWDGCGQEEGGLLRFLGEGISLVQRKEMLGVSFSPNISFAKLDLSARFVADIPLVYHPKRGAWRLESGYRIELLSLRKEMDDGGETTEALLRLLVQAVVEGVARHLLLGQLGPRLGSYLHSARAAADLELEVDVFGIPLGTFDAPLGGGTESSRHAASLLGLGEEQVIALLEAQRRVARAMSPAASGSPSSATAATEASYAAAVTAAGLDASRGSSSSAVMAPAGPFRSLGEVMRYFSRRRLDEQLRAELVTLWADTLASVPTIDGVPLPQLEDLLVRIDVLALKPAEVSLRCLSLSVGVEPENALDAVADAVGDLLAANGVSHGSFSAVLDQFRSHAAGKIAAVRQSLSRAVMAVRGGVAGGYDGDACGVVGIHLARVCYEGSASLSRLVSPPHAPAVAVSSQVLADGRLRVDLSAASGFGAPRGGVATYAAVASEKEGAALNATAHLPFTRFAASLPDATSPSEALARYTEYLSSQPSPSTPPASPASRTAAALKDSPAAYTSPTVASLPPPPPPPPPHIPSAVSNDIANALTAAIGREDEVANRVRRETVAGIAAASGAVGVPLRRNGVGSPLAAAASASGQVAVQTAAVGSLDEAPGVATAVGATDTPLLRLLISRADGALLVAGAEAVCAVFARSDAPSQGGWIARPPPPTLPPLSTRLLGGAGAKDYDDDAGNGVHPAWGSTRTEQVVDVFENQRRLTMFRPYSAKDLFALDWAPFSDESGRVRYASIDEVAPPQGWEWVSGWRVDLASARGSDDGWQYGIHFNTGWLGASNPLTHVRRRRWLRRMERVALASPVRSGQSEAAPATVAVAAVPPPAETSSEVTAPTCNGEAVVATPEDVAAQQQGGLFQLSVAEGARLRLSAEGVEISGELDHIARTLAEGLESAADEWYVQPLATALQRFRRYISSPTLRVQAALEMSAVSTGEPGSLTVSLHGSAAHARTEGGDAPLVATTPEQGIELANLAEPRGASGGAAEGATERAAAPEYVVLVRNTVNLIDFVSDMHEIYRVLTDTISSQGTLPAQGRGERPSG